MKQLDYQEDLEFLNEVYKILEPKFGDNFITKDIVEVLQEQPHLLKINIGCLENKVAKN